MCVFARARVCVCVKDNKKKTSSQIYEIKVSNGIYHYVTLRITNVTFELCEIFHILIVICNLLNYILNYF